MMKNMFGIFKMNKRRMNINIIFMAMEKLKEIFYFFLPHFLSSLCLFSACRDLP